MKLKVWCDYCDGTGKDESGRNPLGDCTVCNGDGFTLREVVELPDGRAVVVTKGVGFALDALARGVSGFGFGDLTDEERSDISKTFGSTIAALFTGGVYEAKAVGNAVGFGYDEVDKMYTGFGIKTEVEAPAPLRCGDLIAVGLKEVGK